MKFTPFWQDDCPRPADLPVADEPPGNVDVAIVGSGYTGLNAARVLAATGARVAVLERHTIGWGASSRNGGMATPGIKQAQSVIRKRYGEELARKFWQASLDAIDLLDEIVTTEGIDCAWRRCGHVQLAAKASHFPMLQEKAVSFQREYGHRYRVLERSQLTEEIGSRYHFGGLVDEYSGGLHPARYVYGLARVAARRGATLCEQTDVRRIRRAGSRFVLETGKGEVEAVEVLVCTNGYTDELVPGLKARVFPVGSYIIVTAPLPADLQDRLSPNRRMYYTTKNFLNYFRLTPDGRMLWGGRNDLSTDLDLETSAKILYRQLCSVFPELHDYPPTHSWSGHLGLTFDLMPHIGRIQGVHYAFGYGGHGLSIATYVGTEAGLLLAGKKASSPFAEIPHPTMFFYRKRPWFLPAVAQYYRLLDRVS
ncbi:MAG: FAD-binding oxidoreductase [Caldilineae bacterium]|nr:MAG: FAD-binding oxidoreductase [Caldilineae bacterium]